MTSGILLLIKKYVWVPTSTKFLDTGNLISLGYSKLKFPLSNSFGIDNISNNPHKTLTYVAELSKKSSPNYIVKVYQQKRIRKIQL